MSGVCANGLLNLNLHAGQNLALEALAFDGDLVEPGSQIQELIGTRLVGSDGSALGISGVGESDLGGGDDASAGVVNDA